MTGQTLPKFKNWTKPETVVEALERSLEHAKIEHKWSIGSWFDLSSLAVPEVEKEFVGYEEEADDDDENGERVVNLDEVTKAFEGLTCTDVQACSAGIVAIETLDGEALFHYLSNGEELDESLLREDPICWGAILVLSDAFVEIFGEREDDRYSGPLNRVITRNDNNHGYGYEEHHARIVAGFERSVELAKERGSASRPSPSPIN